MDSINKYEIKAWQMPRYKTHWRNICAILPVYLSDGSNGSQVLFDAGSVEYVQARLSWVLNDFFSQWCSSKALFLQRSQWILQQLGYPYRRRLPLLVAEDLVLVPVKVRQPLSRNHGADGYVVLSKVIHISAKENGTAIILKNQNSIQVLDSLRTMRQNLKLAMALHIEMEAKQYENRILSITEATN